MQIPGPWHAATLQRRYKRFLADVQWPSGERLTVHTPNTGAMLGCAEPGMRVWLRDTQSSTRKYRYSWELSEYAPDQYVGVAPSLANALLCEALERDRVGELSGYETRRAEVPYGSEGSRIDWLLGAPGRADCYVEVKSVTLAQEGMALFPDAVSARGRKHLRELVQMHEQGHRAVMLFCVQREDVEAFAPAEAIDPAYAETLRWAVAQGVEVLAYRCRVAVGEIEIAEALSVQLSGCAE